MENDTFRSEVQRRLVDTFDLMLMLNLRSKASVRKRVEAGTLPPPVFVRDRFVALWDKDEVAAHLTELAREGRITVEDSVLGGARVG